MQFEPPPNDPMLWDVDLPLRAQCYPLGFPLEIVTNSPKVLVAAEESWGMFKKVFSVPGLEMRIGVLAAASDERPPVPVPRGQRDLIAHVADSRNYMVLNLRKGFGFGWLTEGAVQDRAYLRYHFLEGPTWMLLESLFVTSIHAACVELDGRGVLLCGDSGSGKSSLAYACARNGWTFLSDDSTVLVRNGGGRLVTGNPYQIRFRDSATDLFPELKNLCISPRLSGELSIELATTSVPEIVITTTSTIKYLVFLNRCDPEPEGIFVFPRDRALAWLDQVVCYDEKHVREEHRAALRDLSTADVFEIRYTHLDSALRLLERLIRGGPAVAKPSFVTAGDPRHG